MSSIKNNKIFIHKDMEPINLTHSVEIILTPQFYTFIRENLDLRFAYQAKQIAASLFDDYIDTSIDYQYHVYKCDNDWCFFAYNIEEIDQFLESIGIEKHRVSKIYFAQQLSHLLEEPILLSNKNTIQTIDGTVTIIPNQLMESDVSYNRNLNLDKVKLSSSVSMGASLNSFVSLKETIVLGTLFCILGSTFALEGYRIQSSLTVDEEKGQELIDQNPNYDSALFRENILSKYQPIDKRERGKRDNLKSISKLLSSKSRLKELTIEKNNINANIHASDTKMATETVRKAKAKKLSASMNNLDVKVEKKI